MSTNRVEAVRAYLDNGWVPFLYESEFNPGTGWTNHTADDISMEAVAASSQPIGLLLGKPSNLVVIDIDVQHGGSAEAFVKRYGNVGRSTRIVGTPSGGWHLYFKYPEGVDRLPKVINAGRTIPELGAMDFLADGHHVKAPPTARVGHEGKRDGVYAVKNDVEPAELPKAVLDDWLTISGRGVTNGNAVDRVSPLRYQPMLDQHRENLRTAADASVGELDNTVFARMCSSMRIASVLPDKVLSFEQVELDYMEMPYDVKGFDGKIKRAIEFAEAHPWEELQPDEFNVDIPDDVHPDDLWEFLLQLRRRKVSIAVEEKLKEERLERAAAAVVLPELEKGDVFITADLKTPEWIIEGLLHHEGKAMLSAEFKAGKSTLMIDAIRALTSGTPFLGDFKVPKTKRVVFFDLELGRPMAQRWLKEAVGIDYSRLGYLSLLGRGEVLDMRSKSLRRAMAMQLREMGADVLIIDPISPVLSALGLKENESEDIRPLLDSFDQLAAEADLDGLILTSHTGHQDKNRSRGSSAFGDWPTALWNMQVSGEGSDAIRSFGAKGRDVSVRRSSLKYNPATRGYTYNSEQTSGEGWREWIDSQAFRELTPDDVMSATNCTRATAISRLTDAGWVVVQQATRGKFAQPAKYAFDAG